MEAAHSPRDLAELTHAELTRLGRNCPDADVLTTLFETMFFASLQTEEGRAITFDITYLDPANPDPDPPERAPSDRWSLVSLKEPIALSVRNLAKIAMASDPRTSSFAVHSANDGELLVWALIDQVNQYHAFVHYDRSSGPERPGIFQAAAVGPAQLNVRVQYEVLGELRAHELKRQLGAPLAYGAIRAALQPGIDAFLDDVRSGCGDAYARRDHWDRSFSSDWIEAVARLLLRMRDLRHGGAVLITPDCSFSGLQQKYGVVYGRLADALRRASIVTVAKTNASDLIHEDYLDSDSLEMPVNLYLDEAVNENELNDILSELDGAIWFISLLSRVDGLVLMDRDLRVHGFGTTITVESEPAQVFLAGDDLASGEHLIEIDYSSYGTRHRSMMRYCQEIRGAVGFVVSQDGDVRAVTHMSGHLIVFDGLQLQLLIASNDNEDDNGG
jgi:hypothetical protein